MDLINNVTNEGERKYFELGYHLLGYIYCSSRNPSQLGCFFIFLEEQK
jgi:hypothetical protein